MSETKQKLVPLSVREFALPVPRVGSIELNSGYAGTPEDGQSIHIRVQQERLDAHRDYQPEVAVKQEFLRGRFRFLIAGRIDGLFTPPNQRPHIEEIKTAFQTKDLRSKLIHGADTHPYCLQLKTYGYFHWREFGVEPDLSFYLVSTRSGSGESIPLKFDRTLYEEWLEKRLDELVVEAELTEAAIKRRKKAVKGFSFPFTSPRAGQRELIETVEKSLEEKKRTLIQAPTGLGKTVGVLYPSLKEALSRGQNVIYVTPKNSQHLVAEDAIDQFEKTGTKLRSLTLTAKSKMCFKAEPLCNPEYCEFAKDYYQKLDQNKLPEVLARKRRLSASTFKKLGEEFQVCPFELQFEATSQSDTVICDYNYVFSPNAVFNKMSRAQLGQKGKPNLVIDEAHNLFSRGIDYYSPSLCSLTLEKIRATVVNLEERFRPDANRVLSDAIETIRSCITDSAAPKKIDPPLEPFLEQQEQIQVLLSRYLESDAEILPQDALLKLYFYWSQFTEVLQSISGEDRKEFFVTFHPHPSGGTIRITCCDASKMLAPCYDEFENVVGFSATLKPFEYYSKLSGLDPVETKTAEFESPFAKSQRKLLLIPQISTKFSNRSRNYAKIAETIVRIAELRPGNYFVFFPSFGFLEEVLALVNPPQSFTIFRQERETKRHTVEMVLDHLKSQVSPTLVFAVQGGVFSEGVDYPGDTVIGAFIVGPPLPSFDLEREEKRKYYQENYSAGFDYAYTYPAMAKAVQAAGRVIRSETDRGIIILMDERFLHKSYANSMPQGWFEESPRELVSNSILQEIRDFWEG